MIELLNRIMSTRVNLRVGDRQIWKNGSDGVFSVKSCYDLMVVGRELSGPWKEVW